jgi:uncharacterized protein YjiS (DUF1127 family)
MSLISNIRTWIERSRLRYGLLQLDGRLLADAGFSRELVEAGVRAWPWRTPAEPAAEGLGSLRFGRRPTEADYRAAIAELESYSDTDLLDLGLSRGAIPEAVRNGRPGFPEDQQQAA